MEIKTFKQYFNESNDPKQVLKMAMDILKQKEQDQKDFEKSLKKVDLKKLKRIGFKKYAPDELVKTILLKGIDAYEDILGIPKNTKYMLTLTKGLTSLGGEGQVEYKGGKVWIALEQDRWATGRSDYFSMLEVLSHEMIHVWQALERKKGNKKWELRGDLPYEKRPTEIDAFARQRSVFKKMLQKSDGLFLGRDMKIENGKLLQKTTGKRTGFDIKQHYKMLHDKVPTLTFGDLNDIEFEIVWEPLK